MKRIIPDALEAACRAEDLDRFWNLSQDLLVIATPEGEWVRANPALERILGWTLDDVHTLGRRAITHPDDRDRTRAQAVKLGSGEAFLHFENRVLHKNGGYRWLSWTATPAEGLLYCVARDITAEKSKIAGIHRRDRILASLTESIVLTDAQQPNNPIIYVNPAFECITGYSMTEVVGRNCKFLQGRGTDLGVVRTIASALARRQEFRGRVLNYRKDGHSFVNELSIGPVFDEHGELTHFIGITSDVTEQVRLEERLVQSEARYRLLADNATDLISRIGLDGTRLYVSPSSRDILGYEPDEIMGKPIMELAHPDDRRSVDAGVSAILASPSGLQTVTYRLRHKSGQWVALESRRRLVRDENGAPVEIVSVGRDVTDRLRLDEQLRQAQKMETVGQLTGGIAHDFNNLLTVVLGNAEILQEQLTEGPLKELAQQVLAAAERGSDLNQKLLAFGRRQSLRPKAVRLDEVVHGIAPLLRRTLGEHIELETGGSISRAIALVDRTQLESAILNLAVNARDAMPEGGTLRLEIEEVASSGGNVEYVSLTVLDTGTGIPPDVLGHVFEPFFTTKQVGKGSGLGLAMVHGFVEQSGGHVTIQSEVGHGTAVTILLPAARPSDLTLDPPSFGAPIPSGRAKVLVVEDEADVRRYATSTLLALGYQVVEAADGVAALDVLKQDARVELLFSDVVLPNGISGLELVRRAQVFRPALRVLLTSGYPEEAYQRQGRPYDDTPLLPKPYNRVRLAQAVQAALKPLVEVRVGIG